MAVVLNTAPINTGRVLGPMVPEPVLAGKGRVLALGTVPVNVGCPVFTQPEPVYGAATTRPYRLELRDGGGGRLCVIRDWQGAQWSAGLNKPESLQFTIPATSETRSYLDGFQEVWVFRGTWPEPVQRFEVVAYSEGYVRGGWVTVECQSLMGRLSREVVESYKGYTGTRLEAVVSGLLKNQVQRTRIRLGRIAPGLGVLGGRVRFEGKTILACLDELQALVGGVFWVDTSRRLHWDVSRGRDLGHWVRFGHNALDIRKRTDFRELCTQLISEGTRGRVVRNDSEAQEKYGVIRGMHKKTGVRSSGALRQEADAVLSVMSTPRVTHDVRVVDLSHMVCGVDYSFEGGALEAGASVRLVCGQPAIDISTRVLSVQRVLDRPGDVQIKVGNPEAGSKEWDARLQRRSGGAVRNAESKDLLDTIVDLSKVADAVSGNGSFGAAVGDALAGDEDAAAGLAETIVEREVVETALVERIETSEVIREMLETVIREGGVVETEVRENEGVRDEVLGVVRGAFSNDLPQRVGTASSPGEGAGFSRNDHIHKGDVVFKGNRADFPMQELEGGDLAYAADEEGYYRWNGSDWRPFLTGVEVVSSLPPIPEEGMLEVFWGGQVWRAYAGQSIWTATQFTTTLSGTPGSGS